MAGVGHSARTGQPRTKTLSWRPADQVALAKLRAHIAARYGVVWTERDVVAAAIRAALDNPASLGPGRPAA